MNSNLDPVVAASPAMLHGFIALQAGVDYGLIRASGVDAATFLNSQLTSDIKQMSTSNAQLAAFCTAKGRMLASLTAWKTGDDILLECDPGVLPATLKRLAMFVMRAKTTLSDATSEIALFGLLEPTTSDLFSAIPAQAWAVVALSPTAQLIRLPAKPASPARYLLAVPQAEHADWLKKLLAHLPTITAEQWHWAAVQSAIGRITLPTVEQFVPQMLNFESVGGVNFKKGCYPGQEIVARSQYLGKLKRRMLPAHSATAVQPGQEVFNSRDPDQPAGMVVLCASAPGGGFDSLIELKLAAADGGSLSVGDAILQLGTLPYELLTDI